MTNESELGGVSTLYYRIGYYRISERVKCFLPLINLIGCDSPTVILEAILILDSGEKHWFPDNLELDPKSPIRFRSCDSTLVDSPDNDGDDLFSQFIRSPSPDGVPTTVRDDDEAQAVVDVSDSSLSLESPTGSNQRQSSCRNPRTDQLPDTCLRARNKLRILRVKPPKTKITLRLIVSKGGQPDKQQRPRKKLSIQRR